MTSFETAATVLGALLVGGALLSGIARRSFLSLTAIFVLVGFALGKGGFEVLDIAPRSTFVKDLALTALVLILFRDGLEVEAEMLQKAWHLPLRKLVLAMPITAAIVALATKALTDLTWTEAAAALTAATGHQIEAQQVTGENLSEVMNWCGGAPSVGETYGAPGVVIKTLEGSMRADLGDWVIRGVQGEFYPCKPDIFDATYELVT